MMPVLNGSSHSVLDSRQAVYGYYGSVLFYIYIYKYSIFGYLFLLKQKLGIENEISKTNNTQDIQQYNINPIPV